MSVPVSATETGAATSAPQRVGPIFIAIYVLALFGIWMSINLPASVTLALRIGELDPEGKATSYSMAAGIGTLTALLANPLFGRLSDRTRSRFGRRRPWIVVGLSGTIAGAAVIGFSNSMPLLLLGWIMMQAFVNAAIAASLAIVADRIPEKQQGFVGALSGMAASAAILIGVFFVQWFPSKCAGPVRFAGCGRSGVLRAAARTVARRQASKGGHQSFRFPRVSGKLLRESAEVP